MEYLGKEISGRHTIASGIVGAEVSVLKRISDFEQIGVITTKSISYEKCRGNETPVIDQLAPGVWQNAMGLPNPGVKEFRKKLETWDVPKNKFLLTSIVGDGLKEFVAVADEMGEKTDGIEINVSCPHGGKRGQVIGQNYELVEEIVREVGKKTGKPVLVKMSPNVDVDKTIEAALRGGASGITPVNTLGPLESTAISIGKGGVSGGKEIFEKQLEVVKKGRKASKEWVINATGGLFTGEDCRRSLEAGADILSSGSALAGMSTENIGKYLKALDDDIVNGTDTASQFLVENLNMERHEVKVVENRKLDRDIYRITLDHEFLGDPGQFVMLTVKGIGERPFSFFNKSGENLEILYRNTGGCVTSAMTQLEKGDKVEYRGPHGRKLDVPKNKKILFVAGGTGAAVAKTVYESYDNTLVLLGAGNKGLLPELPRWRGRGSQLVYTDDGSYAKKGYPTDNLAEWVERFNPDTIATCGPEVMMKKVVEIADKVGVLDRTMVYPEPLVVCGMGFCGRCADENGYRYCVDGPGRVDL